MSALQFVYALFLRLSALGLLAVAGIGVILPGMAEHEGYTIIGQVAPWMLGLAGLTGLFLLIPWWLPRGLRRPSRGLDLAWIPVLAGLSWLASRILVSAMRTMEPGFPPDGPPMGPELDYAWGTGAMIAGFLVAILVAGRSGEAGAQPVQVPQAPSDGFPTERFAALTIHRILLAFGGVAMITSGLGIYLTMQRDPEVVAFYAEYGLETYAMVSAAICVLVGLSFLFNRTMPRFVHRPTSWLHFPGIGLYLLAVSVLAICVLFVPAFPGLVEMQTAAALAQDPGAPLPAQLDLLQAGSFTTLLSGMSFLGLIVTTILVIGHKTPVPVAGPIGYAAQHVAATGPDVIPGAQKKRKKAPRAKAPKLPAIGAAMKLYLIADWVVLRLLGLALIGSAYMMWQILERDRVFLILDLAQGFAPMTALYIYAGFGLLLTVPFLLPRFIASPQHVFGGLAKAILLVFTALVLYVPLRVAIDVYTPDIYHATLKATVPRVFKAVAGIAVTSSLLIAFFKQLGKVPKMDYQGRPVREYSAKELAAMRHARMGVEAPGH